MSDKDLFLQYIEKGFITDKDKKQTPSHSKTVQQTKGRYDKIVDLHGLKQVDAKNILIFEIAFGKKSGMKKILIIHGRGNNSKQDNKAVLKTMTLCYLSEMVGKMIQGYNPAPSSDGGDGATVVRF